MHIQTRRLIAGMYEVRRRDGPSYTTEFRKGLLRNSKVGRTDTQIHRFTNRRKGMQATGTAFYTDSLFVFYVIRGINSFNPLVCTT
jgi:hypothetical protein